MAGIIINLTNEQRRIMELHMIDVDAWIFQVVDGMMNKCLRKTIQKETKLNKDRCTPAEMYEELAKDEYKDLPKRNDKEKDRFK
jgi:hypothetical protein